MGRKTVENPRNAFMRLRFTARERLAVETAAAAAGMNLSDYARTVLLREKGQTRAATKAKTRMTDPGVEIQLRRIGVNLNQIAHRLNAQDLPAPAELTPLLTEIRSLLAPVRAARD